MHHLLTTIVGLFSKSALIFIPFAVIAIIVDSIYNRRPTTALSNRSRWFYIITYWILLLQACSLLITAFIESMKYVQTGDHNFFVSMFVFNVHLLIGAMLALLVARKISSIL